MTNRTLAMIGIGLYLLGIATSVTDANGNPEAPDALVMLWETANIIFVVVAGIALWKLGSKGMAFGVPLLAIPSLGGAGLTTPNDSSINLAVNTVKVAAFITYFYAVFLLFNSKRDAQSAV